MPDARAIAFYLPQYHPVPENDEWWGRGFTEWTNVVKARPLFPDHYQPHLPADLGFYDLRLPEAREAQANFAKQYGIYGFCYYHYWFNGRRILERPFNEVLASGKPDFPFCLCWANENWTRAWDGGERHTLLEQNYSPQDDLAHIQSLIPALRDDRYIRINGKPLLLIYRTESLPNPALTAQTWRAEAERAGLGEIYLARVESFNADVDPRSIGFDAAVEFAPDWRMLDQFLFRTSFYRRAVRWGFLPRLYLAHSITEYDHLIQRMLAKPAPLWHRFRCVTPGFDNSARRTERSAAIFMGSTPEKYQQWLTTLVRQTLEQQEGEERILFVNAWNEWAEGNHLEPDMKHGHGYLEATRLALRTEQVFPSSSMRPPVTVPSTRTNEATFFRDLYSSFLATINQMKDLRNHIQFHRFCRKFRK